MCIECKKERMPSYKYPELCLYCHIKLDEINTDPNPYFNRNIDELEEFLVNQLSVGFTTDIFEIYKTIKMNSFKCRKCEKRVVLPDGRASDETCSYCMMLK